MKGIFTLLFLLLLLHQLVFAQAGTCPANIDFEAGSLQNWNCYVGTTSVQNNGNVIAVNSSSPVTGRHTLYAMGAFAGKMHLFQL